MRKLQIKKVKFYFYSLFLLAVISGLIIGLPRLIKIREIVCKSQFGPCPEQIEDILNSALGKNLRDSKIQLKDLLKNNFYIKEYSTVFKFPAKIEVNLVLRKPHFAIKTSSGFYLVSKDGFVISKTEKSNLPFMEISRDFSIGEKLDEKKLFAIKIVSDLFSLYTISLCKLEENGLMVKVSTGTSAIFPLEGDVKRLVGAFRLIIEQLNTGVEKFRIDKAPSQLLIDLRYKNPVIR